MRLALLFLLVAMQLLGQGVMTPEKLWELNRLSGGTLSPSEQLLLYSSKSFDIKSNSGNGDLFVYDLKLKKAKQITSTPFSEFEAQWDKNNNIWFLSTENEGLQIWKMNADGSAKVQVSHFKNREIEGFKLSPNGAYVVCIEAVKTKSTANEIYSDLPMAQARIETDLMYRHWDHFDDYKKRHLVIHYIQRDKGVEVMNDGIDILEGESYDGILPPFGGTEQFTFTQDGNAIIYTSKKLVGKDFATSTNSELYRYDLKSKTTELLTKGYMGYDNAPAFSPNGELAWLSMARNGFEADKNDLIVRNLAGKDENLTQSLDVSVGQFTWSNDGAKIYFIAGEKGSEKIFSIDVKTKKIVTVAGGMHDYVSLSAGSKYLYAGRQSMLEPTDLYSIELKKGKVEQLTFLNKEQMANLKQPSVREHWVNTTDGKKILVWMILPPDFDSTRQYPALLYCQGGPQSMVSQFFSYRWNFYLMASQGYIVIAPNRRGLPGFGQEWNDAISKDWGGQPIRDYLSATDYAAELPYVDQERIGAIGASYGGYSVLYLAGNHNKRFKTFISHCGLFNLESWYGTTEELFFANWDHGGPYWEKENKENYEKYSPHRYVQNWDTPIMIIQGGSDFRVPEAEGMQAFQAAQLKGLKSKYLYFPEENHWILSPQNGVLWQREFFSWLKGDLMQE